METQVNNNDVVFSENFENINLWSNENPYLYRIDFTLYHNEKFIDKRSINFGFREVKIKPMENGKGPFILLNGKPIKFRGVNRHEFHPDFGHAVPAELIYKDLIISQRGFPVRAGHHGRDTDAHRGREADHQAEGDRAGERARTHPAGREQQQHTVRRRVIEEGRLHGRGRHPFGSTLL